METRYKWPPFISQEKKASLEQELNRIIKNDLTGCVCGQLSIRFHTFNLDTHFKAELRCKCGTADQWGVIEGVVPEAELTEGIFVERRLGKDLRSAIDRRKSRAPNVVSTRNGEDRRSGEDRRQAGDRVLEVEA